jgi:hypothetical protein
VFTEQYRTAVPPIARWQDLPLEHLQLPRKTTAALRTAGVRTLADACSLAEANLVGHARYFSELADAVTQLRQSQLDDGINWRKYWKLRGNELHQLAAALPELSRLAAIAGEVQVDRASMGNAGAMLQAAGVVTIGDLVEGLRNGLAEVQGLGRTKLRQLFDRMVMLADECSDGSWPNSLEHPSSDNAAEVRNDGDLFLLSGARDLPLSILQLGTKSRMLADAGLTNVRELADADLRRLKAIGRRTIDLVRQRLRALGEASSSGVVDWQRFAEAAGLPLLPKRVVATGSELISILPAFLADLAVYLRDDSYRDILANRLTRPPQGQATLEEIAQRSNPRVSRERIRQKEEKLLSRLTEALLWGGDANLGVHFRFEFTQLWRRIPSEFDGIDEIGFDEFVGRLASVWDVSVNKLAPHLPFIVAVVTGEPQIPTAFRAGVRVDPRLRQLSERALGTPILRFRLGKGGRRLAARGVSTLSLLIDAASEGTLSRSLETAMAGIAEAVGEDGAISWQDYAASLGLLPLPPVSPSDARTFIESFDDTIGALLSVQRPTGRAAHIFSLRTGRPAKQRMTLSAVAARLATHGPTVKREETEFLRELHGVIVDRDFSYLSIWLDQIWLDYCAGAHSVFLDAASDYEKFSRDLALGWGVSPTFAESTVAGLWAIFSGYPKDHGRLGDAAIDEEPPPPEPARIVLRGFRRLH